MEKCFLAAHKLQSNQQQCHAAHRLLLPALILGLNRQIYDTPLTLALEIGEKTLGEQS